MKSVPLPSFRKAEPETAAAARKRLEADRPAMLVHDGFGNGKSDSGPPALPAARSVRSEETFEDAGPVVKELANRGILVRYFGQPSLGLKQCLRISIGTTEENELFLRELADILQAGGTA